MGKDLKRVEEAYKNLEGEAKESLGKFRELIEKSAMDPAKVEELLDNHAKADVIHPELANVEGMTSQDYAAIYKKMSEEIKVDPAKYAKHIEHSGMSAEELSELFAHIEGAVVRYPEVWESKEKAELLHPKNLAILAKIIKGEEE